MDKENVRASRMTKKQKEFLVDFLEKHKFLLLSEGKLKPHNLEKYKNTWATLAENLNSLGGSTKNVKEWKASLGTFKEITRKKARALKQEIQGTGGGPQKHKDLNPSEEKLLSLLSPVVISGLDTLPEAGLPEITTIENTEFLDITGEYDLIQQPIEPTPTNPSSSNIKSNLKRKREDSTITKIAEKHEQILKILAESNCKLAQSNIILGKALKQKTKRSAVLNLSFN